MAISKIILNGVTQMDVTQDTVASANLLYGETATGADGQQVVGAYVPASAPTIESLSVTPSETQQTYNSSSVDGYKPVTVGAIPSNYVGSGVTRRSSSDMTASGATVTAPAGYYSSAASKTIPDADYFNGNEYEFFTDGDAYKWRTRGFSEVDSDEGDTPGYIADKTRHNGEWVEFNAIPANTSVTPTESSQTIGGGRTMMAGAVTVNAIPPNYVGSGITQRSSSDLTASGATVTVPSGYYSSQATKSVTNGTAGTPTATKGTVSNHAVAVTPSVTNSAGYITGGTKTGTAVSVSASELVSGNLAITQNGTNIDVTNYSTVSVAVEGGGGGGGTQIGTKTTTHGTASASISFTGLSGEPTSFVVISNGNLATGASPYKTAAVVWDGSSLHGQTITNTTNAQVSYDESGFSKSYSNGTLTITGTGTYFQNNEYTLVYSYGGTAASIDTADVQVGSGATSITFTGLSDEPTAWSCIFKSNFSTSSGYQRVIAVVYDGSDTYGMEMDSSAHYSDTHWSYTYNNGSLTIASQGTNAGGYFHQPGYYQLTAVYGEASPYQAKTVTPTTSTQVVEADSGYDALSKVTVNPIPSGYVIPTGNLAITQNGTGINVANYSTVSVSVPTGGGASTVATATITNSSNQNTSISFTNIPSRPIAFFVRCTGSLARSSNSSYYYVADMAMREVSNVETVVGNSFRVSNGTYANVTSGYSFSYSGTTLTVSSSGARNSAPGSFYNSGYELTYVY